MSLVLVASLALYRWGLIIVVMGIRLGFLLNWDYHWCAGVGHARGVSVTAIAELGSGMAQPWWELVLEP